MAFPVPSVLGYGGGGTFDQQEYFNPHYNPRDLPCFMDERFVDEDRELTLITVQVRNAWVLPKFRAGLPLKLCLKYGNTSWCELGEAEWAEERQSGQTYFPGMLQTAVELDWDKACFFLGHPQWEQVINVELRKREGFGLSTLIARTEYRLENQRSELQLSLCDGRGGLVGVLSVVASIASTSKGELAKALACLDCRRQGSALVTGSLKLLVVGSAEEAGTSFLPATSDAFPVTSERLPVTQTIIGAQASGLLDQEVVRPLDQEVVRGIGLPGPHYESASARFFWSSCASHFLLNFALIGQSCFMASARSLLTGDDLAKEPIIFIGYAFGAVVGNLVAGMCMDCLPCNYCFALSAFISAANLAVLPYRPCNKVTVFLCSALLGQGVGVGDCSYGALIWVDRNYGLSKDGMSTSIKHLGTCLGILAISAINMKLTERQLACAWSSLCFLAGSCFMLLRSPSAPLQALTARCSGGSAPNSVARRETIVMCVGAAMTVAIVGTYGIAQIIPANYLDDNSAKKLLLCFNSANAVGQLLMSPIMKILPPAAANVLLLMSSAAGFCLIGIAFSNADFNSSEQLNIDCLDSRLLVAGYALVGLTLLTNFSVLVAFMGSLVKTSGVRSSILGIGAAFAFPLCPLLAEFVPGPVILWISCAVLLVICAFMVVILETKGHCYVQVKRE